MEVTCTVNLLQGIPHQMSRKQRLIWPKMMQLPRTKLIDLEKIANSPMSLFPQRLFLSQIYKFGTLIL